MTFLLIISIKLKRVVLKSILIQPQLQFDKSIKRGFRTITKLEQNLITHKSSILKELILIYNLQTTTFLILYFVSFPIQK